MNKIIAVAGKGGTGKTTLSALIVRHLVKSNQTPVLAVDADPNSNLGETFGINIDRTVGDIRENFMKDPQSIPSGMDKTLYLEMLMNQVIIENKGFDLLVMGRQEGQGCYCMVNNILNHFTEKLSQTYKHLIIDNEAGMEHLSRRTSGRVDCMFIVTDYSLRGLRAVKRIDLLINSLKLNVGKRGIVVNRSPEIFDNSFDKEIAALGLPLFGNIPEDHSLLQFDMNQCSLMDMDNSSLAVKAVDKLLSNPECLF